LDSQTPIRRELQSLYGIDLVSGSCAAAILGGHEELNEGLQFPSPPLILDVRSRMSYEHDDGWIFCDIRVPPDRIAEWARNVSAGLSVVAYCT